MKHFNKILLGVAVFAFVAIGNNVMAQSKVGASKKGKNKTAALKTTSPEQGDVTPATDQISNTGAKKQNKTESTTTTPKPTGDVGTTDTGADVKPVERGAIGRQGMSSSSNSDIQPTNSSTSSAPAPTPANSDSKSSSKSSNTSPK